MRTGSIHRALVATALVVATLGTIPPAHAGANDLEFLGYLPTRYLDEFDPQKAPLIDPVNRRLYVQHGPPHGELLTEFDLDHDVPKVLRDVRLPLAAGLLGPNSASIDSARRRAYVIDYDLNGQISHCPNCSLVRILDLESLEFTGSWNLSTLVPNFYADGLTFSPADNRLYIVGTVIGYTAFLFNTIPAPAYPVTVIAIDVETGALEWAKPVPECQRPVATLGQGAPIFRSDTRPALYVPCLRPDAASYLAYPGQSGLVRLWIDPRGGQDAATSARTEFFPISGTYVSPKGVSGLAVFDRTAERLFMLSQSRQTPGAWVFDGGISAWVGFVPASDEANEGIGIDQSTGHVFLKSGRDRQIVVADGRATPVPQGRSFAFDTIDFPTLYVVDDPTHRVFVRMNGGIGLPQRIQVLRDRTLSQPPPEPIDYDSLTTDIEESASTHVAFSGSVNGFGARMTLVGGYGGVTDPLNPTLRFFGRSFLIPGHSPGDRGVTLAQIGSVDVRNVGASASAQAVAPDALTTDDHRNARNEAGHTLAEPLGDAWPATGWPWPAAACLDGDGERPLSKDGNGPGGESRARCDLRAASVSAEATAGVAALAGVSIASSSFRTEITRTGEGVVTETTATARGIEVETTGGSIRIGRVGAVARTAARGRPGTASRAWESHIADVRVTDDRGRTTFACDDACDPDAVADAINTAAALKVRVTFPRPQLTRTRGGAFASVSEKQSAYYNNLTVNNDASAAAPAMEMVVYNDAGQKSRVMVQVAAIQASSIYGISAIPDDEFPPSDPPLPPPSDPPAVLPGPDTPPPPVVGGPPSTPLGRLVTHALLMIRSPRDAFAVALLILLVAGAAAAARRRHALIELLEESRR